MKRVSQHDIDYILDNTDIVSLVSEYVKLEKRGRNYIGLCPFHNEKTPSFTVSPEKKISHCFGCGGGGNIFQFLSQIENITYGQAISKLGSRLGLNLEDQEVKSNTYDFDNKLDVMYYAHSIISDYYNYILLNTKEAEPALNYLINRGITKESIKHFNIGYAPANNNIAVQFLKDNNIELDYVVEAGIIGKSEVGYYDVFKDRIVFPIKDDKNRIVAFSGRTMSEDKAIAKYYNTHETPIFEKRDVLYNLSDARQFISKENNIIICEGYMDVISAHQNGVKNVVAIMGTNLDDNKVDYISNLVKNVTLALDNDKAGQDAILSLGNKFFRNTDNVYKLNITTGKDIDEFLSKKVNNSDFNFSNYVDNNRIHFLDFKISYYNDVTKNNIDKKIKAKDEILLDFSYLKDSSLRDILLTNLANSFGIEKYILAGELAKIGIRTRKLGDPTTNFANEFTGTSVLSRKFDKKLCKLFKYFLLDRNILLEFYDQLESINFENSLFKLLLDNIVIYYNSYELFEIHRFVNNLEDLELINLATYIDNGDFLIENPISKEIVSDYINYFKNNKENEVTNIKENLRNAILAADYESQLAILEKLKNFKK